MTAKEAWEKWDANYWLIKHKIIPEQGKIIKEYIRANNEKMKIVMTQDYYSTKGQPMPTLQIHRNYYYHNGNFYRHRTPRIREEEGDPRFVEMIAGEELQKLWQNMDFVKSLLGMDLDTGACHP